MRVVLAKNGPLKMDTFVGRRPAPPVRLVDKLSLGNVLRITPNFGCREPSLADHPISRVNQPCFPGFRPFFWAGTKYAEGGCGVVRPRAL